MWSSVCPERGTETRIAFWSTCKRGTGVSTYDYADYIEQLGMKVMILCSDTNLGDTALHVASLKRFRSRFSDVVVLPRWQEMARNQEARAELDNVLKHFNATDLYVQKTGVKDKMHSKLPCVRNLIHCVFDASHPHGTRYARISASVPGKNVPILPLMVRDGIVVGPDLRSELEIPSEATVLGSYGGAKSFNIGFVKEVIDEVLLLRSDVYFVFLNHNKFGLRHHRKIFLPSSVDETKKKAFIRTCDAMLHARREGETYGLAVAEFSMHNKPIITSSVHHDHNRARMHIDTLKERGVYYHNKDSLRYVINNFNRTQARLGDWKAYKAYSPLYVTERFLDVFG